MSDSWPEIVRAISAAPYPATALPVDPARSAACLKALGVTTKSWLGAVVANSGGILVDHGWIRVLGSGDGVLPDVISQTDSQTGALIAAYDILGGQFAWLPPEQGARPSMHYFAPDTLEWENLKQGYGEWLSAVIAGGMTGFYETLRWPGWQQEVATLSLDQGLSTWPPPFTTEGKDLATVTRKAVPMTELLSFYTGMPQ
ncbi:hypothetical protein Ahu01nite_007580 [Winogradskya humida]|uniref:DUF2625 family protein n=2 Tax=Winogradskya humida TaxID=113566 RepID=A0ABQ3ZGF5_9ACTN|nr:hypothetical protein Ahu01nite_007580 [Actinoplanes humidus]